LVRLLRTDLSEYASCGVSKCPSCRSVRRPHGWLHPECSARLSSWPQGLRLPAAGWPWIPLGCEKDLCERAVKSLMGASRAAFKPRYLPLALAKSSLKVCPCPAWQLPDSALALLIGIPSLTWDMPCHHRLIQSGA